MVMILRTIDLRLWAATASVVEGRQRRKWELVNRTRERGRRTRQSARSSFHYDRRVAEPAHLKRQATVNGERYDKRTVFSHRLLFFLLPSAGLESFSEWYNVASLLLASAVLTTSWSVCRQGGKAPGLSPLHPNLRGDD
jgi:hypothetical protein